MMKTEFQLQSYQLKKNGSLKLDDSVIKSILVPKRKSKSGRILPVEVMFRDIFGNEQYLNKKDLKKFATNILKLLNQ